ncbi:MAG TPA: aspartate kinase [Candidatus Limiplasma sp.]|nr:aspartate kinase [Candidatus Limiplasma sp.]
MGKIVAKFGGSSLSDAGQFQKVRNILMMDKRRVYVVPSAPGKRHAEDEKVTDLLYAAHRMQCSGSECDDLFARIRERYSSIADALHVDVDLDTEFARIRSDIAGGANCDYCASRGEYLNGLLLSKYLGFAFIDPKDTIFFNEIGLLDSERTNAVLGEALRNVENAVIPGFYGCGFDGEIRTFTRGGSDVTGAIVARAADADVYENWTDVSGFLMADPRIVRDAKVIHSITYQELRELSYMGATVLHQESVFPVQRAGIPTNLRNTNHPHHIGTMITMAPESNEAEHIITGIAGRVGFSVISVEKAMMNVERGFGRKVLQAIEELNLNFEHLPTGIDSLCVVLETEQLDLVRDQVKARIMELTNPDYIDIQDGMGLIATVGRGMVHNPGTAARLFSALSKANVNVRMIDQGSGELSILVGVDTTDFKTAIQAIYAEFVE